MISLNFKKFSIFVSFNIYHILLRHEFLESFSYRLKGETQLIGEWIHFGHHHRVGIHTLSSSWENDHHRTIYDSMNPSSILMGPWQTFTRWPKEWIPRTVRNNIAYSLIESKEKAYFLFIFRKWLIKRCSSYDVKLSPVGHTSRNETELVVVSILSGSHWKGDTFWSSTSREKSYFLAG